MKRIFAVLALAATAALLWHSATPAQACSCLLPSDPIAAFTSNAEIVLVGTVTGTVKATERGGSDLDLRVSVEEYLKGSGPSDVVADDPVGGGDCGMFDTSFVGKRYVLFLSEQNGHFRTGLCAGNTLASADVIERVRSAAYLPPGGGRPGAADSTPTVAVASGILLTTLGTAALAFAAKGSRA